jgi:hyperosmotically inducible protein
VFAAACAQSDIGLTTKVKAKLAADDTVKAYKIDVDTKNAIVTLNGSVDNDAARAQAVQLARATDGVKDVVDNLKIEPPPAATTGTQPPPMVKEPLPPPVEPGKSEAKTDTTITAEVKGKLLEDRNVSGLSIDVDTDNGVVTLKGKVKSAAEKAQALKLANSVAGVTRVVDKLTIKSK